MNVRIPQCYRRPLKKWFWTEFNLMTDKEIAGYATVMGLYITPVISQTHIVFAVCKTKTGKMLHALKLERDHDKDAKFVSQAFTLAGMGRVLNDGK